MIAVIDYKAGNLTSVVKALHATTPRGDIAVTDEPEKILQADHVVLPGVGHFFATQLLQDRGLLQAVLEGTSRGIPFLGICVGLQWLFAGSTESPGTTGLGFFPGTCERFPSEVKSPHVGWNSVSPRRQSRLFAGVEDGAFVYYTHSYRAPLCEATVASTEYGGAFTAAVESGNVMGVQFHPEKSGETGLRILRNFLTC